MKRIAILPGLVLLLGFAGVASAATPPHLVNYQGVLRDASDNPLNGNHDMVFRFFSADVGGDEILIDTHDTLNGNPVPVTGGLFDVELGSGAVSDGSGPGTYTSLAGVFSAYADVYLSVGVGGETLSPRIRVVAAAYALNASRLEGSSRANISAEIDGDIVAHSSPSAHHSRYTNAEAATVASGPGGRPPRNPVQIGMLRWYEARAPLGYGGLFDTGHGRAVVFDGEHVYLGYASDNGIYIEKVRPTEMTQTYRVSAPVQLWDQTGSVVGCLVSDGEHIWVSEVNGDDVLSTDRQLYRFDASTGGGMQALGFDDASAFGCAFDGENVWFKNVMGDLAKIRASDATVLGRFPIGDDPLGGIAFDGTDLWVVNANDVTLSRVRTSDGMVLGTYSLGSASVDPRGIAFDGEYLWIALYNWSRVVRVDPSTPGRTELFNVGPGSLDLAFDGAHIWLTHPNDNLVTKLAASDGSIVGTYPTNAPNRIAFDGVNVWVTNMECGASPPDPAAFGSCSVTPLALAYKF